VEEKRKPGEVGFVRELSATSRVSQFLSEGGGADCIGFIQDLLSTDVSRRD
jgi:hypothetical protein